MAAFSIYDGTNWVELSTKTYVDGTFVPLSGVLNGLGLSKLGVETTGSGKALVYVPYVELVGGGLISGTTTTRYLYDGIKVGTRKISFPSLAADKTLAVTSDIKHVYRHTCTVRINYCPYQIIFYNTSNAYTSLYNIMFHAMGKVLSNLYQIGEMIGINSVIQNGSYVQINADHYYKNNSNYIIRENWSGYDVTLDQESITEV